MARNVSNEFKNVIQNGGPFYGYAEVLLHDGTQLTITSEDDLLVDGNEIQESGGYGFPLGVALSRTLNMSIDNTDDRYSDYDFYYARITMYTEIDLSSGGVERLKEGTFTVTEPVSPGDEINFTAYDDMYKAAKTYVPKVSFPATALSVLQDVCSQCDINLGSATFLNSDFQIPSIPDNLTCRQVIGYIAMIAVGNAVFDENNRLLIKSYNFSLIESFPIISGGKYDEEIDETIYGGVLTDDTQNVVTGGKFGDESEMSVLSEFSSDPEISTDDVVITGIRMESLDSDSDEVYVYGTEDYALTVQNELVSGKEQELIQMIGDSIIGVSIRPFSGKFFPNPSIQFMDFVFLVDRKSNTYTTFIANNTFSYLNDSEYSNELESPLRNNSQYYSEITEVYRKAREEAKKQKSEWEKAMEELSDRVNNSSGLYMTSEEQPDGSSIYYMHDKPTLEESMIVWKMTAEAFAVSTDGGKTYNAGLTVDGTLIAKIMNTIGINFDWGVGGTLIIQDSEGHQTAYIDAETGTIRLEVESLKISGKTPDQIAEDKINDFVSEVYDPSIANLQKQIDGQIETWYYDYEPSLSNYPASEWTTENERKKHEGDLFYWKEKGYSYRFFYDGTEWKWQIVQDTDITKALASAAKAQDTADGKRRVFSNTPYPPYDVGDLWSQGSNGDLMICVNQRQSGTYTSSDWDKASKYTDDTVANEALEEAKKSKALNIILSNEYQSIPTDPDGNYDIFPECSTFVQVYWGNEDISSNVTYDIAESEGITGSWNVSLRTYTVSGLSTDSGWVDITASYLSGDITSTKRFNISKQKQGMSGTSYSLESSTNIVKKSQQDVLNPNYVEFNAVYNSGDDPERMEYLGRFVIEETSDGTKWTTVYTSSKDESSVKHHLNYLISDPTPFSLVDSDGMALGTPKECSQVRCKLYASGGTETLIDVQSVTILTEAPKLTSEEVFNILTDYGTKQGIFMENNQIYINGEYIRTETLEAICAKLAGWTITGNKIYNNQEKYNVKIQSPTAYGTSGNSNADVLAVKNNTTGKWPFVVSSDGSLTLSDYFKYRPDGMDYDENVHLLAGGWQIKNGENAWGYDHFEYWDTQETQENGICSHGPWVIWGGWNQGPSLDYVNSYKFVVSDQGDIYGQKFFDNGQQILPIIAETMHVTFTSGWTGIIKSGYFLLNAFLVRSDNTIYVDGIQRRSDGWYLVLLQKAESTEADLYTVWCKNPD